MQLLEKVALDPACALQPPSVGTPIVFTHGSYCGPQQHINVMQISNVYKTLVELKVGR